LLTVETPDLASLQTRNMFIIVFITVETPDLASLQNKYKMNIE